MFNQSINYMKRKTTFLAKAFTMLFAVLLSLVTSGAAAQETLTVYEDGEATSANVPVFGYYGDAFNKCEFIIPSDELGSMINGTISQMAFYLSSPATESWGDAQFQVFLKEVSETTLADFTGAEGATIVYEGALDGTGETMTIDFTSSYTYGGGNLLVGVYQTVKGGYKSASFYGVTAAGASITGYSYSSLDGIAATARDFIPKTTFAYTGGSFDGVLKPTGLKVSYEGGTEATISWSSEEEVFDIDVNGTVTENVENPTTLTGLEYATVYTVKVRAKRGEEMSDWSNPVTFNTDISDDMCQIMLVLTDSYGDGWNGNAIQITDVLSGIVIGTYANQNLDGGNGEETQTIYVDVPNDRDIRFTWVAGSYATETSYAAYDINEEVIFSGSGEALPTTTWHVNCAASPWRSPADLAASEITAFSATLSWTERSLNPATSWVLAYAAAGAAEYTEVTVTENPYVLEGLTPETTYAVKVRPATDEVEFWSDEITFTTDVQFPAVQDLAVEPTATTATVTWTPAEGATSYVLEYADPSSVTFVGDWYKYDNGTATSGVNAGGSEFNYAVMFPAGSFTGNALNKVSIFDGAAATGTVIIYAGGTTEPGTEIASSPYTLTASNEFVDVNFNYITVNPEQNLWVVVTNPTGAAVATADDELGDANGRWLYYGNWGDLATAGVSGKCWLIHAEIGTADFSSVTWTTVEGATSPAEIAGLTPETDYLVRVKAIYGEEGESAWTSTNFTTTELNAIATNVVVTPGSTTATIEWTGESDSYEVKYRSTTVDGASSYVMDFESGLGDWTNIKNGEGPNETEGWYTYDPTTGLEFNAHSGTYCASAWSWTNNTAFNADNWLITPKVTFDKQMKYWVRTNKGFPDAYEVLLSTAGNEPTDFTVVLQEMAAAPAVADWTKVSIDLSAYEGQEGYIAFHHVSTDCNYLLIDDFSLNGEDTPAGEWVTVTTSDTSVELTGLTEETTYEFTIIGIKDGEANAGTPVATFTTLNNNPVPYDIVADLTADGANLTWKGNGEDYVVRYRPVGESMNMDVWNQVGSDVTATGEATEYSFDLSEYSGTGYVAIRHYNISDMFNLCVDDITLTNATGATVVSEDFTSGEMPADWDNLDYDGDGNVWGLAQISEDGNYCAYSASFINNVGAVTPDNWLIIPNVELGGTLSFQAWGMDSSYADEVFAVFVSTEPYTAVEEPWTEIVTNDPEATISGLDTNNAYEYQIKSIKGENESEWSELGEFALVTLDCNGDNTDLLNKFNGKLAHVTLANRTFYKDDTWNTIFLPFNLTEEEFAQTPLADGELRTLTDIDYDEENDIVTLNFDEAMGMYADYGYPGMVGGNPYIIKWAAGSNVENPEFANVTISNAKYYAGGATDDESIQVEFYGTYDWMEFPDTDQSFLFLGADNTLYYPEGGASVAATRGFFYLIGVTAGEGEGVKFCTNLDGANDPTGIANLNVEESGEWYDLSGRKLAGKPVQKGIYVNGGRKVTVK